MGKDRELTDYPQADQHLIILLVALTLGLLFDHAFHGRALGLSFPIFTAVCLLAFWLLALVNKSRLRPVQGALASWAAFFALSVYFRSSPFLAVVNVAVTIYLVTLLVWSAGGFRFLWASPADYITIPASVSLGSLEAAVDSASVLSGELSQSPRRQEWLRLGRGAVFALPVLGLFAILFSSADMVFQEMVVDLLTFVSWETWWRGATVLVVAAAFLGLYVYAFLWEGAPGADEDRQVPDFESKVEASVVLVLVNLLFLGFIIIQFKYLFGGQAALALPGTTYAEYARRGFFELLAVAALVFAMIWLMATRVWHHAAGYPLYFKFLGMAMFAQVFVIIASALHRLVIYEGAFGFTTTRFYAHSSLYLIAFLTVALAVKIVTNLSDSGFLATALVATLLFLLSVNLVSPDRYVAEKNIARYRVAGDLDVDYLATLSDDATPSVAGIPPLFDADQQGRLDDGLEEKARAIRERRAKGWQSFRAADGPALAAIKERQDLGGP